MLYKVSPMLTFHNNNGGPWWKRPRWAIFLALEQAECTEQVH